MFSAVTAFGSHDAYSLHNYHTDDRISLAADCVIVAALVSLICIVVIGKINIGLPGPVGTINNSYIQAMIGVSAGIAVLDGIAVAVKLKKQFQVWGRERRMAIATEWRGKLNPHVEAARGALPKYTHLEQATGNYSFIAWDYSTIGRAIDVYYDAQFRQQLRGNPSPAAWEAHGKAKQLKLDSPSQIPEADLPGIAQSASLADMYNCTFSCANVNTVFEHWFGINIRMDEAAFMEAMRWSAQMSMPLANRQTHLDEMQQRLERGEKMRTSGSELEVFAFYYLLKHSAEGNFEKSIQDYVADHYGWCADSATETMKAYIAHYAQEQLWEIQDVARVGLERRKAES